MPRPPHRLARRLAYWARHYLTGRDVKATAAAAGMSRNTLYRLLDPPDGADVFLGSVESLADALGVDPLDLLRSIPDDKDRPA